MFFKTFSLVGTLSFFIPALVSAAQSSINLELTLGVGKSSDDQGESSGVRELVGKPSGYYRFVFAKFEKTYRRIQLLEQCAAKLCERGPGNHEWDFEGATNQLCYDMWARLEIEEMPQTEQKTYPQCESKQIPFHRSIMNVTYNYKLTYEFLGVNPPRSHHYIDVMRCECYNKYSNDVTVMQSRRSFLIHQLQHRQYIILAPVDRFHKMKLKMVDFQDFNPPAHNEKQDEKSPLMFTFLK